VTLEAARRRWLSVLALAPLAELERAWEELPEPPSYRLVRAPEVGLVMVQARTGGTGQRFNLGEMTVTRCTVALEGGRLGHGWVGGRAPRRAELCALFDALLQDDRRRPGLEATVVARLERAQQGGRAAAATRAAPTRVEFLTMVRGDD
jgi:alpha-D-ribose 1-methylphosphonate 5-triphosphate synthase subunit PhnG